MNAVLSGKQYYVYIVTCMKNIWTASPYDKRQACKVTHCAGHVLPNIRSHHTYMYSYTVNSQHLAFVQSQIGKEWAMCTFCCGIDQYLVPSGHCVLLPIIGDVTAYHCIPLSTLLSASHQHRLCLRYGMSTIP